MKAHLFLSLGFGLYLLGCVIKTNPPVVPGGDEPDTTAATDDTDPGTDGTDGTDKTDKTDGTGGTGDLKCALPSNCTYYGVCDGTNVTPECKEDATWDCHYELVPEYEPTETSCDSLDNDCDGTTDEGITLESCEGKSEGVCAAGGLISRCIDGAMVCDLSGVANYQENETACDDADNDCDGETDEGLTELAVTSIDSDCLSLGVCATAKVSCVGGTWQCDYIGVSQYEPGVELSCDGLDNNCDGTADEGIDNPQISTCKQLGVCKKDLVAVCNGGVWDCDYGAVIGYEAGGESLCDGKDNDCDGKVDEDLTDLESKDCDPDSKEGVGKGVCEESMILAVCTGGKVVCTFENVPGYEAVESSCDNKDNDCNGKVDDVGAPPPGTCSKIGVCGAGSDVAECSQGEWVCDFSGIEGWEADEQLCDGKDNDCNGLIDDGVTGGSENCPGADQGLCKGIPIPSTCFNGAWQCDYSAVVGWEEAETTCDGQDNDCDGLVDENIHELSASTCLQAGVCKDAGLKVQAACDNGLWTCKYGLVPGYEEVEVTCDGKDNDCDGVVDEDIADLTGEACGAAGVCAGNVEAFCVNGEYKCDYTGVLKYENPEVSCDQKDNNCDTSIDEDACLSLQKCNSDPQCKGDRVCRETPDPDSQMYCVDDKLHCPGLNGTEQFALFGKSCLEVISGTISQWYLVECQASGWKQADDPCSSGACVDGACKTCIPDDTFCQKDPGQPLGENIVQCDASGDKLVPIECPAPGGFQTHCVLHGVCLYHEDQKIGPTSGLAKSYSGRTAPLSNGGGAAVWHITGIGGTGFVVAIQALDAFGVRAGGIFSPQTTTAQGINADVAGIGAASVVVVWQRLPKQGTGDDPGDIQIRIADTATGKPSSVPAATVNNPTENEQSYPRVAKRLGEGGKVEGAMVVWQGLAGDGGNGFDVYARRFDLGDTGLTAPDDQVIVNTMVENNQQQPSIAALGNGGFIVAWEDDLQDKPASYGVYGRVLSPTGIPVGDELALHMETKGEQRAVEVAAMGASGFAAVWTTAPDNAEEIDVLIRKFDDTGAPLSGETIVTKAANGLPMAGVQTNPDIAITAEQKILVAWEEPSNGNVFYVQLNDALEPVAPPVQLNQDETSGVQSDVGLSVIGGSNQWLLGSFSDSDANGAGKPAIFTRAVEVK